MELKEQEVPRFQQLIFLMLQAVVLKNSFVVVEQGDDEDAEASERDEKAAVGSSTSTTSTSTVASTSTSTTASTTSTTATTTTTSTTTTTQKASATKIIDNPRKDINDPFLTPATDRAAKASEKTSSEESPVVDQVQESRESIAGIMMTVAFVLIGSVVSILFLWKYEESDGYTKARVDDDIQLEMQPFDIGDDFSDEESGSGRRVNTVRKMLSDR